MDCEGEEEMRKEKKKRLNKTDSNRDNEENSKKRMPAQCSVF